jgi:hypothetical protein
MVGRRSCRGRGAGLEAVDLRLSERGADESQSLSECERSWERNRA